MDNDITTDDNGEGLKLTAYYSRKRGLPDYSSEEASVFISQAMPGVMQPEEVANHLQSLFVYAKSEVYQQLALPFEQDEATGRIMESFPDSKVVAMRPKTARAVATDAGDDPSADQYPTDAELADAQRQTLQEARQQAVRRHPSSTQRSTGGRARKAAGLAKPDDEELWEDLANNPDGWWDNRINKRNPKGPDWSHKTKTQPGTNFKVGLWLSNAPDWFMEDYPHLG